MSHAAPNEESNEYISLKVVAEDESEVHFKMKILTDMKRLKRAYSDRQTVSESCLIFIYNGRSLSTAG